MTNPRMFGEIARSGEMHTMMMDVSHRGAAAARGLAPEYAGPTWVPTVTRHGEYKASIYSAATLRPNGWRGEFGATARITLQVEFGTGGGSANGRRRNRRGQFSARRRRPQKGWSPKARVLGRALESLRRT
ncbi:hypothetical protein [Streptomyces sp. NPDC004330]|uniref:hypothetical protein n=1 Tax=Streptomyces sp. NPDC004330 TaxID=3364700 RepID=UPI0036A32040